MNTYIVRYQQKESGLWVGCVHGISGINGIDGCIAQGRTISQVRQRTNALLVTHINDAEAAKFVEDVALPKVARTSLARYNKTKERAESEAERLKVCTFETAELLTFEFGFSQRDVGDLMGLSHQRIHQLLCSG